MIYEGSCGWNWGFAIHLSTQQISREALVPKSRPKRYAKLVPSTLHVLAILWSRFMKPNAKKSKTRAQFDGLMAQGRPAGVMGAGRIPAMKLALSRISVRQLTDEASDYFRSLK